MTIHTLTGFAFIRDLSTNDEPVTDVRTSIEMRIAVPDNVSGFSYSYLPNQPSDDDFLVDISVNDIFVAFNDTTLEDIDLYPEERIEVSVIQLSWGAGKVTQLLVVDIIDEEAGEEEEATLAFRIGGDALPTFNSVADFTAFENSITSDAFVPGSSAVGPNKSILYANLPGVVSQSDTIISGTDNDDELDGTNGNDAFVIGETRGEDQVNASGGDDYIVFTSSQRPDFYSIDYRGISGPITIDLDADWAIGTVTKAGLGIDHLIDVHQAANYEVDSLGGEGVFFYGTSGNDTFNINMDENTWIGVRGSGGNDTFNIGNGANLRIDYREAASGINANLNTGLNTGEVRDGDGGTDQIIIGANSDVRIEIHGSDNTDTIVGSGRDERFILREGNDTLDAGGGWDVLRYDRSGVGPVTVNLATETATGTWNGNAFTHSIAGIEEVRGSRSDSDSITGDGNDNSFRGRGGDDTLNGGGGNDTLVGEEGDDVIDGGAGRDEAQFWINRSEATITQSGNNATVVSSLGTDILTNVEVLAFNDQAVEIGTATATPGDDVLALTNGDDTINGLAGNDVIEGRDGNDSIIGGQGDDSLRGENGNDTLFGGEGRDNLYGQNGNDRLDASGGSAASQGWGDYIRPGLGNDTIIGHAGHWATDEGADLSYGELNGVGGITINVGADGTGTANSGNGQSNDNFTYIHYFEGSQDADNITGSNEDRWEGFSGLGGNDTINGRGGDNRADYSNDEDWGGAAVGISGTFSSTGNTINGQVQDAFGDTDTLINVNQIRGTDYGDTLNASNSDIGIRFEGEDGNDDLIGSRGDDRLEGDAGNDTLIGGDGRDRMYGGDGNDLIDASGGAANTQGDWGDFIRAGLGQDTILGHQGLYNTGNGVDISYSDVSGVGGLTVTRGANGSGSVVSGDGRVNDSFTFIHAITGSQDNDVFNGSNVAGTHFAVWGGLGGNDTINGGSGDVDIIYFGDDQWSGGIDAVSVNFTSAGGGTAIDGFGGHDTFTGIEGAFGTDFDDTLDGNAGAQGLYGSDGDDIIFGRAGNDELDGGDGNDELRGGEGNDEIIDGDGNDAVFGGNGADNLIWGRGEDTFDGGNGNDTLRADLGVYAADEFDVEVNLQSGEAGAIGSTFNRDQVISIENVIFENALIDAALTGNDAANILTSNQGTDTLLGGNGADTLNAGAGNDIVAGGNGRDLANLGNGADVFNDNAQGTDAGRDTVFGGNGNDTINGGGGFDEFRGDAGNDSILGGGGFDQLFGGAGSDTLLGGLGNDTVGGGDGRDEARLGNGFDVFNDNGQGDDAGRDTVFGGNGNDTVNGGGGFDEFYGEAGNDVLFGGNGFDRLFGGANADQLFGGAGNDTLNGGVGQDQMTGGAGLDRFVFASGFGTDTIFGFDAADGEKINLAGVGAITDFADLVMNHLEDASGTARIVAGTNSILLDGVNFADVGIGLAYSGDDFIF
ncbi:calcium-binding protein [Shimia sp.]|uniref:beta strand repeat-containing protein n=1 Tax=Shimia sp. TaxID=1954381 RepID=UPI00329A4B06